MIIHTSRPLWSACGEAPRVAHATTRPLVIALHASASSARQWRALAARLEPQGAAASRTVTGYRVIAVDLHDHGVGPAWTVGGASRAPLTLEDEAALVAPLLAEAGRVSDGGGVHLVGHSYGGAVALKVACQHPQHVRSLVLYEPVAFRLLMDDPASHAETQEALAVTAQMQTRLERDDVAGAAQHFVDYWSGSGTWQAMPAGARAAVEAHMPIVMQHFGALFNERQQVAAVSRLAVPTLVLSGERTVATARRIAKRLRTLLANAVHEALPGLGHMGPVTHAEFVAERIAAHLQAPARAPDPMPFPSSPVHRPRDLLTAH
ncbi:MAG: alpha/beta hydrolase [Rubrivivax sp.]|nr:alpha/beta hydrolase [Rubrivivax sp.]